MFNHFAYLAGYIDGDGCFRIYKYTNSKGITIYERSITITSVCEQTISYFVKQFGGVKRLEIAKGNRRNVFVWTIKNNDAKNIAHNFLKYLVIKKNQCINFINYCENITYNNFKPVRKNTISIRENCIVEAFQHKHFFDLIEKSQIISLKTASHKVIPNNDDFAYLAGICDSEGCFRISKRYRKSSNSFVYNTCLEIGNTKFSLIQWLYQRFQGCLTFQNKKTDKHKNFCTWSLHSKSLKIIVENIFSMLITKKQVCQQIIHFQNTILKNGGKRSSIAFKLQYELICAEREKIITQIHLLNQKGKINQVPSGCHKLCSS